jgi:hypothetical protein
MTVKAQDIAATERKTTKNSRQENPESTTHHLKKLQEAALNKQAKAKR